MSLFPDFIKLDNVIFASGAKVREELASEFYIDRNAVTAIKKTREPINARNPINGVVETHIISRLNIYIGAATLSFGFKTEEHLQHNLNKILKQVK